MIHITLDGRDNGANLAACSTCCCHTIHMRPGETNLLVLNYAPWSVPIGGHGLRCDPSVELEINSVGCPPTTGEDPAPLNTAKKVTTDPNAPLVIDLTVDATPAGGDFTYSKVPLSGPYYGVLTNDGAGQFTYTPNQGFTGWDEFWFKQTDDSGRSVTRQVLIWVSEAAMPAKNFDLPIEVNTAKIVVDANLQQISIPVTMTNLARSCEIYRLHIKARALNCDLVCFDHISCFDFIPGKC